MRLILLALLALAGCGEPVQNAPGAGSVVELPPIEWRVVDRDTLEAVYRNSGQAIPEGRELEGFAGHRDGKAVVYTLAPRSVNDAATCALGHEIMHVALGSYHE